MADIHQLPPPRRLPLACSGVGRDVEHDRALAFYFNRPVTDAEMRFLHEVIRRASLCMPDNVNNREPTDE